MKCFFSLPPSVKEQEVTANQVNSLKTLLAEKEAELAGTKAGHDNLVREEHEELLEKIEEVEDLTAQLQTFDTR